ncbi:hypothetical protein BH09CHL1_BH09CHL1_33000 [soil metagenome]
MARRQIDTQTRNANPDAESLALRLSNGYQRIDDARAAGIDTTALEEFWLSLLHQYEAAYNDVAVAA